MMLHLPAVQAAARSGRIDRSGDACFSNIEIEDIVSIVMTATSCTGPRSHLQVTGLDSMQEVWGLTVNLRDDGRIDVHGANPVRR